ncbi:hypothetical protein ACFPM0_27850 [Pseudonocardia sulfidoxydans]|uniref:UGSC family (seleno)protein n=1 Tax=Pseudonocardia sulfidoxydans TaxID=54011 RepID=UPI00361FEC12
MGLRRDIYWKSWDWVTDEWAALFERDGARIAWWRHTPPVGKEATTIDDELDAFLGSVDAAVIGLCNCGSCTMWSVHDALRSLSRNLPTVLVSTEHFESLARTLAAQSGRPEVKVQLLPYPLEGRNEPEVRTIAREYYPHLLLTMGAVV